MSTDLQAAINHWTELATKKEAFALNLSHTNSNTPEHAAAIKQAVAEAIEAGRVADSLRAEARTGAKHCSCTNPPHAL